MSVAAELSEFVFKTRYARHVNGGRESWTDAVNRVRDMHIERWPQLANQITHAFEYVHRKEVLPSMRALQRGGQPILDNNLRIYNCAATPIDRLEAFAEYFYLLLCGCGVGISVRTQDINKLPTIPSQIGLDYGGCTYVVEDSIEGWADCVKHMFTCYLEGLTPEFDFSLIRPAGAPISSGGVAPGPESLATSLDACKAILEKARGRKLRPIEAYDICMHLSAAVLSGGIRRSATIALFSPEDKEMYNCKTGSWFTTDPQRQLSNNSVVLDRNNPTHHNALFKAISHAKQYGDPGIFWSDGDQYLTNPCGEIGLEPYIDGKSGVAFCNLTSINGATAQDAAELIQRSRIAAFIGTLQAAYTDFPYLQPESAAIAKRDGLLGVSICGFTDNPDVCLDAKTLQEAARAAVETNKNIAGVLGINPAKRVTCVKPDGTTSLILGGIAAGAGTHHSPLYLRRIQNAANDPVYRHFAATNPQLCDVRISAPHTHVVTFPITAPDNALMRSDMNALEFLDHICFIQENWVQPGTVNPGTTHAVSHTITVKDEEWPNLVGQIWKRRNDLAAVALMHEYGDKAHPQSPRESVETEQERQYFTALEQSLLKVDWSTYSELIDNTKFTAEPACAGGACEL